jgi:glycine cleavage system aminomethyltransferase T
MLPIELWRRILSYLYVPLRKSYVGAPGWYIFMHKTQVNSFWTAIFRRTEMRHVIDTQELIDLQT